MSIVGARPNFMKVASVARAIANHNLSEVYPKIVHTIVHTGQHYDDKMSTLFFKELEIPRPQYNLEAGSASHAVQTAQIMERFEPVLHNERPDVLLVVGDVNSTIACALVAAKVQYDGSSRRKRPVIAHLEAGLRSGDRDMPEEINRIVTDALSDFLFTTEEDAGTALRHEGISREKIYFVGNVMIDTLIKHKEKARTFNTRDCFLNAHGTSHKVDEAPASTSGLKNPPYGIVTLHRPSNVDTPDALMPLMHCIKKIASRIPLIFPLHPRTKNKLEQFELCQPSVLNEKIIYTQPLGYLEFLNLLLDATLVLTDSGGIQEETTFLNIPCITLRENTERPVTVTMGTNYLVGTDQDEILQTAFAVIDGNKKEGRIPPLWDGKASARIIEILSKRVEPFSQV